MGPPPSNSAQGASIAVPLLQRDLSGARAAYTDRDTEASAVAHKAKTLTHGRNEPHVEGGEYVKLVVFGGLDGILTSFAIVAGAAGVGLSVKAVLGIGISNVLADALAMAVGEYLSTKSEKEYIAEERSREAWEFKNFPEGEVAESTHPPPPPGRPHSSRRARHIPRLSILAASGCRRLPWSISGQAPIESAMGWRVSLLVNGRHVPAHASRGVRTPSAHRRALLLRPTCARTRARAHLSRLVALLLFTSG
jgi:hypothetical protein